MSKDNSPDYSEILFDRLVTVDQPRTMVLDARAEYVIRLPLTGHDNQRVFSLRLDGMGYSFVENPDDGYRSSLDKIYYSINPPYHGLGSRAWAEFNPIVVTLYRVLFNQNERTYDGSNFDGIYGVSESSGLVIFIIGTSNDDDYYPVFITKWIPHGNPLDKYFKQSSSGTQFRV